MERSRDTEQGQRVVVADRRASTRRWRTRNQATRAQTPSERRRLRTGRSTARAGTLYCSRQPHGFAEYFSGWCLFLLFPHLRRSLLYTQSSDDMSVPPQLLHTLEGIKYQVKDAFWALSSCICQQSAKVKINGRTCASTPCCCTRICSLVLCSQDHSCSWGGRLLVCLPSAG